MVSAAEEETEELKGPRWVFTGDTEEVQRLININEVMIETFSVSE